jgi:hypothetical protein
MDSTMDPLKFNPHAAPATSTEIRVAKFVRAAWTQFTHFEYVVVIDGTNVAGTIRVGKGMPDWAMKEAAIVKLTKEGIPANIAQYIVGKSTTWPNGRSKALVLPIEGSVT